MIGSQQRERKTWLESCSLQEFTNNSENVENGLDKLFQTSFSKDSGFEDINCDRKHLALDSKSNTCGEGADISFNSEDNLDIEDYKDTFLKA